MNIFDCAVRIEEKAKAHYEDLEKGTSLPDLKNLFSMLAAAEEHHIETLDRMKENMEARGVQLKYVTEQQCTFIPLKAKENVLKERMDDPDFFLHAVKEEEEDIRYYEDLAAKERNEEVRSSLNLLAEEERKHLGVVENIYTFAEAPRSYLAWGEFSNLDEL